MDMHDETTPGCATMKLTAGFVWTEKYVGGTRCRTTRNRLRKAEGEVRRAAADQPGACKAIVVLYALISSKLL